MATPHTDRIRKLMDEFMEGTCWLRWTDLPAEARDLDRADVVQVLRSVRMIGDAVTEVIEALGTHWDEELAYQLHEAVQHFQRAGEGVGGSADELEAAQPALAR